MLKEEWNGWHAGNSRINRQSIGFEHAGFSGRNQWTMDQYRASARLARYLCDKYGIPKTRSHIIGHNEVPGASHGDPGKYFDWDLYMRLIREGDSPSTVVAHALTPAEGQVLGRGYVPQGPQTSAPRRGLKVRWNAEGGDQRGARVLVEQLGGSMRYDSGYLAGAAQEHTVDAALEHGVTYRWRSLVFDGNKTVESDWVTFKTDFTRPDVVAVSPAEGAEIDATPELRWRYSDPDGTNQVGYRVQIDNDTDHSKLISDTLELNGSTDHYFVRANLKPGRTYHWRVMGHDGRGNVSYTPWRTFTTSDAFNDTNSSGLTVAVLSPQGGAQVDADERPVLSWTYHNGNQREQKAFRVQIDDDTDGSAYAIDRAYKNPRARGFRSQVLAEGEYRWRVGVTDGVDTAWSGWATFVVGEPEGTGLSQALTSAFAEQPVPAAGEEDASATSPTGEEDASATSPTGEEDASATSPTGDGGPGGGGEPAKAADTTLPASASADDSTTMASLPEGPPPPTTDPATTETATHNASAEQPEPEPQAPGWTGLHEGLQLEGAQIPRRGLANRTLRSVLKLSSEPLGATGEYENLPFVAGKASWFGGSRARGKTALTGERLNRLGVPARPSAAQTRQNPERYYFIAMRWDYRPQGGRWWSRQRLLVVNPKTGAAVVVRPVDWGPHTKTGRIMNLSQQAMRDLGVKTDEPLLVAFATPGTSLGPK
jgi:hypothetical protein